jgi:hypothetical protein
MKNEKIYIGNGKSKFDGNLVNATIDLQTLNAAIKEHAFAYNEREFIKIKVVKRTEPDNYGNTHFVEVDTWRPVQNFTKPKEDKKDFIRVNQDVKSEDANEENLPF